MITHWFAILEGCEVRGCLVLDNPTGQRRQYWKQNGKHIYHLLFHYLLLYYILSSFISLHHL